VQWINGQSGPFFAYVAFNAPHFPYQMPPLTLLSGETAAALQDAGNSGGPYCAGQLTNTQSPAGATTCADPLDFVKNQKRIFYNAMLEAVDTEIGNLLAQMSPEKRANTAVFVIGDNGTPHEAVEPLLHVPGHAKGKLYELSVRVPMIAAGTMVPRGEHTSNALIHAVDLWRTCAEISGADPALAAPSKVIDSIGFSNVLVDPDQPSARTELFVQGFVRPGEYRPTEVGPYTVDCTEEVAPGVFSCVPKTVGEHGRSLSDGQFKLILSQTAAAQEVLPEGSPDILPVYAEELYDILADPEETTDLAPLIAGDPMLAAIRDQLRDRLTQLSGF
jgi:hypothetical protein